TLLRLVAGFEQPSAGRVLIAGRDVSRLSPADRGIGMVFQNYALFPHLTARKNIEYGLKMRGWGSEKRRIRAQEMIERMRLDGLASSRAASGSAWRSPERSPTSPTSC